MSKRKKIWLLTAPLLAALALWFWLEFHQLGRADMRRAIEDWRRWGGATSLAELTPAPVAAEFNAAPVFHQGFRILGGTDPRVWRSLDDPWKATDLEALVERFQGPLEHTRRAAAMDYCVWPIVYQDGDQAVRAHLAPALVMSRLLIAEAIVRSRRGDHAGAAGALSTGVTLGEMLRQDPSFVAAACQREIESGALEAARRLFDRDAPPLDAIAASLARRDYRADVTRALVAEGALWLDGLEPTRRIATPLDLQFTTRGARIGTTLYLDALREQCDYFRQPRFQAPQTPFIHTPPPWATLLRTLDRTRQQFTSSLAAYEARAVLAMTAMRLRAHRQAHGEYPQALDALPHPPIDPWDGQPLRYQKRDTRGFVLWSTAPSPADTTRTIWEWE